MNNKLKSASSGQAVSLRRKLDEAAQQFLILWRGRNPCRKRDYPGLERDLSEYRAVLDEYGNTPLDSSKVFEIGCGQRPYRLLFLIAQGIDAYAVDMDRVVFSMGIKNIRETLKTNGLERAFKTLLRYCLFDIAENYHFRQLLSRMHGGEFHWPLDRIVQGNAAYQSSWPQVKLDFIYSEDVFEHIPKDQLHQVCTTMADCLKPDGIALVRPMVYSGIQGGHNVDYYNLDPKRARKCPPWDHLLEHRYPANTHLNEMSLADYRALFSSHFEVLDESVRDPQRGDVFMTESLRDKLKGWSDEELFSNHVRFILRRK